MVCLIEEDIVSTPTDCGLLGRMGGLCVPKIYGRVNPFSPPRAREGARRC
jgi:hypothetical protein